MQVMGFLVRKICKVRLLAVFILGKKLYAIFAAFFIYTHPRKAPRRNGNQPNIMVMNYLFENATNISK